MGIQKIAGVLTGWTMVFGLVGTSVAQTPKVEDILARKPVQPGVAVSTPIEAELAGYQALLLPYPKTADGRVPTSVAVKDAQGRFVRQFIDTTGSGKVNIWSYYLNGVESYREVSTKNNGKPDQYRWLGANGGKWGVDLDQDGVIDQWIVLSPAEASQELFTALQTRDEKRLQALIATEKDVKEFLGIPEPEVGKILSRAANAAKNLQTAAQALNLNGKEKWVHLELTAPSVTPADTLRSKMDITRHRSMTVLLDRDDGKSTAQFQTGEMIQVGNAWRLIDGPSAGTAVAAGAGEVGSADVIDPAIVKEIEEMTQIKVPADRAGMPKYHADRAVVLAKIVAKTQAEKQQPWLKQLVDAYASGAEMGDKTAGDNLKAWVKSIEESAPKTAAASYASFRAISAEYATTISKSGITQDEIAKLQKWWRDSLEAFVAKYPSTEETPEAMMRLAVAQEMAGKEGEVAAKSTYEKLADAFKTHRYAAKARGAVKRLSSEGQPFELAGQTLDGKAFSTADLNGKPYVVMFYAGWGRDISPDLKQLAELSKLFGDKGLDIVTISLDEEAKSAVEAINASQVPGHHLHAAGGLDSAPPAVAYGIQMVPHLFLVGKDGKIVSRNAQTGPTLKDEVEKLVK